jgi:hypothetical protein
VRDPDWRLDGEVVRYHASKGRERREEGEELPSSIGFGLWKQLGRGQRSGYPESALANFA